MQERREALRIIGAISATCVFPFESNELYGQHEHGAGEAAAGHVRKFFSEKEWSTLTALVDEIVPATDTPGASQAGVPGYIDFVAGKNEKVGAICRAGLKELGKRKFVSMKPAGRERYLRKLCDSAEKGSQKGPMEQFWITVKNLTADGYYTSKAGMSQELGFKGGSVLSAYPACETVPEH